MLLETLDIKKDDIVIYSQNIFDLENNFKIIFKDDIKKKTRKIGFDDVCHFVNEYTPKNLIVYRLMTNISDFSLYTSKFGVKIYISEEPEIIYFDPVFAIKELEEFPGTVDENLRFRIQQIGLTTLSRVENVSNFAEIYSIDLRPYEAKYQKDKVFADAIFALNTEYNSPVKNGKKSDDINVKPAPVVPDIHTSSDKVKKDMPIKNKDKENSLSSVFKNIRNESKIPVSEKHPVANESGNNDEDLKFIKHDIGEDKDFDYKQILKMKFNKSDNESEPANEFPKLIKHDPEKKFAFRERLKTNANIIVKKKEKGRGEHFTDIFKSPEPLIKLVEERHKEKIVLRLNKK
jgi:hypothetical protein